MGHPRLGVGGRQNSATPTSSVGGTRFKQRDTLFYGRRWAVPDVPDHRDRSEYAPTPGRAVVTCRVARQAADRSAAPDNRRFQYASAPWPA